MKSILVTTFIVFFAIAVRAQTGMPQTLSCTETAFNFSFNLGTKWKFSMPKMGPVDIRKIDNDIPTWSLKMKAAKPDTTDFPALNLNSTYFKNHKQKFALTSKL